MKEVDSIFEMPPKCTARTYCGKDGLAHFLEHLHHHYYHEVIVERVIYDLFVDRFLYGHKHCDSDIPQCKNEHEQNLCSIRFLLTNRKDLVKKYLSQPSRLQDYNVIYHDLKTGRDSCHSNRGDPLVHSNLESEIQRKQSFEQTDTEEANRECIPFGYSLDKDIIVILTECLNSIKVFNLKIEAQTVTDLLDGTLKQVLVVSNVRKLSYFFSQLKDENLICRSWQKKIEDLRVLLKRDGQTPILARDLSTALYAITVDKKKTHYQKAIEQAIERIRKYYPH